MSLGRLYFFQKKITGVFMRVRRSSAKWLLILTCFVMMVCLIQRAVYLRHIFTEASEGVHSSSVLQQSPITDIEPVKGPAPCQISAFSLLCAQPVFFEGALPALIVLLALVSTLGSQPVKASRENPPQSLPLRIHILNCVFRE